MASDRLCICNHREKEHDARRADHRCMICPPEHCPHFRLSPFDPEEHLVHRHSHGPKAGKGLGPAIDIKAV